jgi:hypothetical protein
MRYLIDMTSADARASAMAGFAQALAATDPDRAEPLATGAEGATQWIASEREKAAVVTGLAQALAAITLAVPSPAGAPSG